MTNDDKSINSNKELSSSPSKHPAMIQKIPDWVIYAWGFLTLIIAILFVLSFILKPGTETYPGKAVSRTPKNIFPPQIVWMENFDQSSLESWTLDWVNLRESEDESGRILLAYRNLEPDKQSKVNFTPLNKVNRFYYAKSPRISLNFAKPYWISFDFHGKGPIELLDFGHIRLRVLSDLGSLSCDPDGTQAYRKISLPSEILSSSTQEKYSFKVSVEPTNRNYEIRINEQSIGRIQYSNQIQPLDQIFFHELPPDTGEPVVNAIYYDNFQVYGTPTQPVSLPSSNILSDKSSGIKTPVSENYKRYYQEGWDKYNSRDLSGAVESFKQAIHENPKSAEAYNGLGVVHIYSGDTQSAWEAWAQALSIDSTYEPARKNLGMK